MVQYITSHPWALRRSDSVLRACWPAPSYRIFPVISYITSQLLLPSLHWHRSTGLVRCSDNKHTLLNSVRHLEQRVLFTWLKTPDIPASNGTTNHSIGARVSNCCVFIWTPCNWAAFVQNILNSHNPLSLPVRILHMLEIYTVHQEETQM